MARRTIIVLAVFAVLTAGGMALYVHTVRALDRGFRGLWNAIPTVVDSINVEQENGDQWWPVLWHADTIGKVVAIGRVQYGSNTAHSIAIYRALLTGRPPAYQPESLAAIDSSDNARYAHELWLIPRRALGDRNERLGTLVFEHVNEAIRQVTERRRVAPGESHGMALP